MDEKIGFKLCQVIDVKTTDLTYPCCFNCYKKVFYVSGRKKWNCSSCNEDFLNIMHRYKLNFGISDMVNYRVCSGFGKPVEIFFGVEANSFYKYKKKISESNERWNDLIENAFRCCLLGRWFLFDLRLVKTKDGVSTYLIKNVDIPKHEIENFISINAYFKNRSYLIDQSNLNDSFYVDENNFSIIDETIIDDNSYGEKNICKMLENFTLLK